MVARALAVLASWLLLALGVAAAEDSAAETPSVEAKLAFERGLELLRDQRWMEAETAFRRSLALSPRPSAQYNLAFVLFKQDRLRQSIEVLQDLLNDDASAAGQHYREAAKTLLSEALSSVAILHLTLNPATAALRVDGELVALEGRERALPLDPGSHRVEISAPGFLVEQFTLVAESRVETAREIALSPVPPPPIAVASARMSAEPLREPRPWLSQNGPWLAVGVGGALLAAALVTRLLAVHANADLSRQCPTRMNCDQRLVPESQRIEQLGAATNVLLASGAAFVAGGIGWRLIVDSSQHDSRHASVQLTASARFE